MGSSIIYFGFNSFNQHKRGVENVIDFQADALDLDKYYYLHWGAKTTAYKSGKFVGISIKNCWYWSIILNVVLLKIKKKKTAIHSHNPLFSIVCIFKTNIFTVHDGLYYQASATKKKNKCLFWFLEHLLYRRCSKVHFISDFTKSNTLFGNRSNFVIIPNSSHYEKLVPLQSLHDFYKKEKLEILIVRSIEERARFDLLLELASSFEGDKYHFIVAGKGPLLEYYRNEIKRKNLENVIEMLGYVDDDFLLQLYASCDMVLTIAEYGEGFGLPIIEGYLFNKPVIASNVCAIPEVIISDEYLFQNSVKSITEKINYVQNIGQVDFREYYDSKFSNSVVLNKIRTLMQDIY